MATDIGIMQGFDMFKDKVDRGNKKREQEDQVRANNLLKQAEIDAKSAIFERDAEEGLHSKIAANRARMAASGISGTSASARAYYEAQERKTREDLLANAFFADLSKAKGTLTTSAQVTNLLDMHSGKQKKIIGW